MTIEDTLYDIGIKKMLVVDDHYTDAAKEYFKDYLLIEVDYATSGKDAITMIQSAYPVQKYDLVLSDMEMEKSSSGIDVSIESFKHHGLCLIVTGQDATGHGHGPSTKILGPGYDTRISGTKVHSDTWMKLTKYVTDYISGDGKHFFDSLQRHSKYVGKPSDKLKDFMTDIK